MPLELTYEGYRRARNLLVDQFVAGEYVRKFPIVCGLNI